MKWLKILFTKKGFNKSKKSQYLFNQMFKPPTKKEIKEVIEKLKIKKSEQYDGYN